MDWFSALKNQKTVAAKKHSDKAFQFVRLTETGCKARKKLTFFAFYFFFRMRLGGIMNARL